MYCTVCRALHNLLLFQHRKHNTHPTFFRFRSKNEVLYCEERAIGRQWLRLLRWASSSASPYCCQQIDREYGADTRYGGYSGRPRHWQYYTSAQHVVSFARRRFNGEFTPRFRFLTMIHFICYCLAHLLWTLC